MTDKSLPDLLRVRIDTTYGALIAELYLARTPITVKNFMRYVQDEFYDGTMIHRIIRDYIVQGGGFTAGMIQKTTRAPIENEAKVCPLNERGTLAMARLPEAPHSATSQFFINLRNNPSLDYFADTPEDWGYCVFGKIIEGMGFVDKMGGIATMSRAGHTGNPVTDIFIESIVQLR
ncbi:MAG: peptidylprolyl isomerase [Gammaproteobacteria bacterium]|nr:peptidylprolyl isomerase [Gammaproteobacteria bacterium]